MTYSTIEKRRQYQRDYRSKNKEKVNAWTRKHYNTHKDDEDFRKRRKETYYKWYASRTDEIRERYRQKWLMWRAEIIEMLGGKCVRCGFTDSRALQVDHVNGDGYLDRKGRGGNSAWLKIKQELKNGINTHRYQLLCANCNWIKKYANNETSNKILHSIPDVPHKYLSYER